MGAIFRREFCSFFTSSIAYVFLAVFFLSSGYFFKLSNLDGLTTDMSGVFSSIFLVIVILVPILTMKSFSEEKKEKTEQGLLTAPVSLGGIVLGKYFASLLMYTIGISIVWLYAIILSGFGEVAWNMILANYAALILVGAAFIAITTLISALTENQMVSAVVGVLVLFILYMFEYIAGNVEIDFISNLCVTLSFYEKYYEFTCGIFNLSSVLFFISTAVIFNFLTVRVFEKRRWS